MEKLIGASGREYSGDDIREAVDEILAEYYWEAAYHDLCEDEGWDIEQVDQYLADWDNGMEG